MLSHTGPVPSLRPWLLAPGSTPAPQGLSGQSQPPLTLTARWGSLARGCPHPARGLASMGLEHPGSTCISHLPGWAREDQPLCNDRPACLRPPCPHRPSGTQPDLFQALGVHSHGEPQPLGLQGLLQPQRNCRLLPVTLMGQRADPGAFRQIGGSCQSLCALGALGAPGTGSPVTDTSGLLCVSQGVSAAGSPPGIRLGVGGVVLQQPEPQVTKP